jgi:hypothetical protein
MISYPFILVWLGIRLQVVDFSDNGKGLGVPKRASDVKACYIKSLGTRSCPRTKVVRVVLLIFLEIQQRSFSQLHTSINKALFRSDMTMLASFMSSASRRTFTIHALRSFPRRSSFLMLFEANSNREQWEWLLIERWKLQND